MIVALLQQSRESMRGPRVERRSSRSSASMVTSALHAADSTPSTLVRQFPRKQVAGTMIKACFLPFHFLETFYWIFDLFIRRYCFWSYQRRPQNAEGFWAGSNCSHQHIRRRGCVFGSLYLSKCCGHTRCHSVTRLFFQAGYSTGRNQATLKRLSPNKIIDLHVKSNAYH
jgi:hypothetical protein